MKFLRWAATVKAGKLAVSKYSEPEKMREERYYPQEVEFQASLSLETRRIPDPFYYYFKDGKLYSPIKDEPVENSITRDNPVEEEEYQAFEQIQSWANQNEAGTVVWISPACRHDLSAKIIISTIVYDLDSGKRLLNRNLCFDWTVEESLVFAKRIGGRGVSEENLRGTPVFLDDEAAEKLMEIIRGYTPTQAEIMENEEDFLIKERLKAEIALGNPLPLGPHNPSCGAGVQSAFNVMFGDSLNISEGSFDCPKCHGPIPSGRGITSCPHCGARKESFNGGCD